MKKLEELGVSYTPWHVQFLCDVSVNTGDRLFKGNTVDTSKYDPEKYDKESYEKEMLRKSRADATLAAAAPALYEALYKLIEACKCDGHKDGCADETRESERNLQLALFEAEAAMTSACSV